MKIVCLVHAFLKGTNNFHMAGKVKDDYLGHPRTSVTTNNVEGG